MLESEEAGERAETQAGRGQNLVYTLPHTTESIAEFLTPVLSRVDPAGGGTQVVVVTRSPETAIAVSETVLGIGGAATIEIVPVTGAARAARLFKARPVLAVAGTAEELGALVRASVLKLDSVRTVVLAWADDILDSGPEALAALEALLGELGEATRVIVARKVTPAVENLIERYARRSRRVPLAEVEVPVVAPDDYQLPHVKYVTIAGSARGASLRRLLDDLDPPSATIIARGGAALAEVRHILRTLGYEHNDDPIHASEGELKGDAHAVIYYRPPVTTAQLQAAALAKPVEVVVLAQPAEVAPLRELAGGRLIPIILHGPERRAQDREDAVREELRTVLMRGVPPREIIFLEPLLEGFDAVEIAAAALQLLDRERAQRRHAAEAATRSGAPVVDTSRATTSTRGGGEMTRLFMTIGTRDGVKTGDLMGAIAGEGGIAADRVGKIDLRESHSLVEVAASDAASVVARLNGSEIKGRRVVVRGERDREERDRAGSGRDGPERGGGRDRPRPPGRDRPPGRMDRGDAGRGPPRRSSGPPDRSRGGPPDRSSRGGPPDRSSRGGPPRGRDRS